MPHIRPWLAPSFALAVALLAASPVFSSTIVRLSGDESGIESGDSGEWTAQSWTQAGSYSGVVISATLERAIIGNPFGNGFAFLEEQSGDHAVEIASVDFRFPADERQFTLFDDLTLGPGTYYLALYGDGFWIADVGSPTIVSAADVSGITDSVVSTDGGRHFFDTNNGISQVYLVTGTPVVSNDSPEPSAALLAGGGLLLALLTGFRYQGRSGREKTR
jgi:hypothetical protein